MVSAFVKATNLWLKWRYRTRNVEEVVLENMVSIFPEKKSIINLIISRMKTALGNFSVPGNFSSVKLNTFCKIFLLYSINI